MRDELKRLARSEGLAVGATFPTAMPARNANGAQLAQKRPLSRAALAAVARLGASSTRVRRRLAARRTTDTFFRNPSDLRPSRSQTGLANRTSLFAAALEIVEATGRDREAGVTRVANLVNKSPAFDRCFGDPLVLSAVNLVVGSELKLSSLNSRTSSSGHGGQFIHADWNAPPQDAQYQSVNVIWLLDDFTLDNGATRVIPGSHKRSFGIRQSVDDPHAAQPGEVLVTARAGSALVMNGHLWHSGTTNTSSGPRTAIQAYFVRRCHEQQLDQAKWLTPTTAQRLTAEQAWLLG